jgi:hypothetical protein
MSTTSTKKVEISEEASRREQSRPIEEPLLQPKTKRRFSITVVGSVPL